MQRNKLYSALSRKYLVNIDFDLFHKQITGQSNDTLSNSEWMVTVSLASSSNEQFKSIISIQFAPWSETYLCSSD
jgi:hypothetical protein